MAAHQALGWLELAAEVGRLDMPLPAHIATQLHAPLPPPMSE